jgi:hypothetical protein
LWGKQLRTKRSLPFLVSCLMGLRVSSLEIYEAVSKQSRWRGSGRAEEWGQHRAVEQTGDSQQRPAGANGGVHTSIFALVQRGTSTTMLRMVCCSLAYRGMSCHAEMGWPSFSMKTRCSSVLAAATLRVV